MCKLRNWEVSVFEGVSVCKLCKMRSPRMRAGIRKERKTERQTLNLLRKETLLEVCK